MTATEMIEILRKAPPLSQVYVRSSMSREEPVESVIINANVIGIGPGHENYWVTVRS